MLTIKWDDGRELDIWQTPHVTRISKDEVRFVASDALCLVAVTLTRPGKVTIYEHNGREVESFSINGRLPRRYGFFSNHLRHEYHKI